VAGGQEGETIPGANSGRAFWKMRGPERIAASLFFREEAALIPLAIALSGRHEFTEDIHVDIGFIDPIGSCR
jgi:hypothetical protein